MKTDEPKRVKTSTILKRAAILIDTPKRWAQGTYYRPIGGIGTFCALGAINAAVDGTPFRETVASRRVRRFLEGTFSDDERFSFAALNDALDTTHGDVMTALALAIVLAQEAGV